MSYFGLVKRLAKIDSECKKDEELRKRLEPWVLEMNKKKPRTKQEAERIANDFIGKYEEIKKQINSDILSDETPQRVVDIKRIAEQ